MRGTARFLIVLAALAFGSVAPAQSGSEGLYVANMMETATALELAPGDRFRWAFSQGALDMSAEGRWRRAEDGSVLLDTGPAVRPPTTELIGTGREGGREVIVRVSDPNGRTPEYLDVEAEYESGEPEQARILNDSYRFEPAAGRRIAAVRVIIFWAGYTSERFELPRGANAIRLRFSPNDLGRADFRAERLIADGDTLTLNLFGQPIRYRRRTAQEQAEEEAQAREQAELDASAMDMGEAGAGTMAALTDEDWANDRACVNEGLSLPRATAIAACTALLDSGRLPPEGAAIAHANRGNLLTDDGQYAQALADFEAALRLNPEDGMAYWGRAGAYLGLGDHVRAIADSREAARRLPENAVVLGSLCWALAVAGQALDEARTACDASLALQPDNVDTLDSRGLVGLKQSRFGEAWADFDAAVRHGEGNESLASFLYGRGIAAVRLGREAEGRADMARAAALTPAIAETYARNGVRP